MLDENNHLKLIDFGTAKLATKTVTFTSKAVGTTIYMAPDFFDVDESHVVYSMKSSPSFVVHCFKTGAKLWELVPTVTSFLELRDLSHGLLLTNNLNGLIRLVRKFKNSFYHSGSNIKYFGLLRIWRLQKQETALVGSISQTTQILCVRYFTTLLLFLSYIRSSSKFIF